MLNERLVSGSGRKMTPQWGEVCEECCTLVSVSVESNAGRLVHFVRPSFTQPYTTVDKYTCGVHSAGFFFSFFLFPLSRDALDC